MCLGPEAAPACAQGAQCLRENDAAEKVSVVFPTKEGWVVRSALARAGAGSQGPSPWASGPCGQLRRSGGADRPWKEGASRDGPWALLLPDWFRHSHQESCQAYSGKKGAACCRCSAQRSPRPALASHSARLSQLHQPQPHTLCTLRAACSRFCTLSVEPETAKGLWPRSPPHTRTVFAGGPLASPGVQPVCLPRPRGYLLCLNAS